MDALHISDKFVQQDYRCIEAGCDKTEGNSQQVVAPGCHIPTPVIRTIPSVDMAKQIHCLMVIFSLNRIGQATVTITGAK